MKQNTNAKLKDYNSPSLSYLPLPVFLVLLAVLMLVVFLLL